MRIDEEFADVYEAEFPTVYRTVLALFGDRTVAEDATQEAFARALQRWRRLRGQPWVGGWITQTAMNAARRASRRRGDPSPVEPPHVDVDVSLDVWEAVRRLPRRQQEAVVLHYVGGLTMVECGVVMRCADGTVKAHLAKARSALRRNLEGVRDDG